MKEELKLFADDMIIYVEHLKAHLIEKKTDITDSKENLKIKL